MAETPYIVTQGIVLRETETKETDKILTVLTGERGKTAVIARGARRKRCRFAACTQLLAYSEWTLYHRGEWYYVNDGATIELFAALRESLETLALGFYFAELTEAVALEEMPAWPLLRHLLNGLYVASTLHRPPDLIKCVFELRLLALAGHEPLVHSCARCGKDDPDDPYLDLIRGVVFCRSCAPRTAAPLCPDSLAALRHILYGDERRIYAFRLGQTALRRLSDAAEAFTTAQLERGFRTLDFYKQVTQSCSHV